MKCEPVGEKVSELGRDFVCLSEKERDYKEPTRQRHTLRSGEAPMSTCEVDVPS